MHAAWRTLATLSLPALIALSALPAQAAVDCNGLRGTSIAPSAIGLPTRGARLDTVTVVRATLSTPEYCRVLGAILPVDTSAPVIQFQVNLPVVWNQKSMQFGGGGYNGSLITGEGNVPHALANASTPLQRGYVTYGSDSGHASAGSDGLINNVAACRYDPGVLRCYANIDWGPTCLTDAQLNTVRTIATPIALSYPLANGLRTGPAYPILTGANFGGPINVGWLGVPLDPGVLALNGYAQVMQAQWVKYFITGDAGFDPQTFEPQTGGRWQSRVQQVSAWHDATSTDLTAFMQRGGKLLILHGLSDTIVSPNGTIEYYKALQQRYGDSTLRSFMRFYTVAGFGHGLGRYQAAWNGLDLLEAWAEQGHPPVNPTSTDALNILGRSRPLCEYPAFPRYVGGWVESASSFRCAVQ